MVQFQSKDANEEAPLEFLNRRLSKVFPDSDQPAGNEWRPMNCPAGCHTVAGRIPQVAANLPILSQRKQWREKERERDRKTGRHANNSLTQPFM